MTFDQMLSGPESDQPDPEPEQRSAPRRRRLSVLTVLGLVLMLAGLGTLGWVGFQYFGTNVVADHQYQQSKEQVRKAWEKPTADGKDEPVQRLIDGDTVALLRVPDWGNGYEVPILKGTGLDILARGVGIYSSSVDPGEIGNFAIAGHRITHGQPFSRLLELKPGAKIVIETRSHIYTYVMDNSPADLTVSDSASWVLDPVPGQPNVKPSKALITLTTCQDLFHSPDRSIGFGHLVSTVNK